MNILRKRVYPKQLMLMVLGMLLIAILAGGMIISFGGHPRQGEPRLGDRPTHPVDAWKARAMAWIYPGPPACDGVKEYQDGRGIDTLKPQYYTLSPSGTLVQLTTEVDGCNAYSQDNALDIKKHSRHQYVTVSGDQASMEVLVMSQEKMVQAVTTLKTFLDMVKFTGVEIDFEGFAHWTPQQYEGYKRFLVLLGDTLHRYGYTLMIDGPAYIADDTDQYQWRYEDFNAMPVDYIVVMAYDWQYDLGVGYPVAPLAKIKEVTSKVIAKITDINKIVVGIPSYGYHGEMGGASISIDTFAQSQSYPGYATAKRDHLSAEMMFSHAGIFYDYADSYTLNAKRSLVESLGILHISVWHLGGNQWFSGKAEPSFQA